MCLKIVVFLYPISRLLCQAFSWEHLLFHMKFIHFEMFRFFLAEYQIVYLFFVAFFVTVTLSHHLKLVFSPVSIEM